MFNFIRKSLMSQLIVFFLSITTVVVAVVGYFSYVSSRDALEQSFLQSLTATAEGREAAIELLLDMGMKEMEIVAASEVAQRLVEDWNRKEKGEALDANALQRDTEDYVGVELAEYNTALEFFEFTFIGESGRVHISSNRAFEGEDWSQEQVFKRGVKEKFFLDVAADDTTGKQHYSVVIPIFQHEATHADAIGVLVAKAETLRLNRITTNLEGLGETGEVYVVNKDGYLITTSRFQENDFLKQKVNSEPVRLFQSQEKVMAGIYTDYSGRTVLGASMGDELKDMFDLGWTILAEIDVDEAFAPVAALQRTLIIICLIAVVLVIFFGYFISRSIARPIVTIATAAGQVGEGNLAIELLPSLRSDEVGSLSGSFNAMVEDLRAARDVTERDDWLKAGIARLNEEMGGELDIADLSTNVVSELTTYLDAQVGAIYLMDEHSAEGPLLSLAGTYAYKKRKNLSNQYKPGEGLVGQAALEKQQILIRNVPEDYVKVTSGLGEATPQFITVTPFLHENRVMGVIEIGSLHEITDLQMQYLSQAISAIGINVQTAQSRDELNSALQTSKTLNEKLQTQQQELQAANEELQTQQEELQAANEELQTQQEELKSANEELEEQTRLLKVSEEKLKAQQEELQVTNEELEEKTEFLERQKRDVEAANEELETTRRAIELKAEELALASKYKSEFLANMSHELRTPLNSLLILAGMLAENNEGNLTDDQVESAGVINASGNDLLALINEILDLSKIEAGQMNLELGDVRTRDLADSTRTSFLHMAKEKGLELEVGIASDAAESIKSDRQRIEQVIKNLMSNALKFTERGKISVNFGRPGRDTDLFRSGLDRDKTVAISVEDTGAGISAANQKIIFEAFQQVEGGSARKHGGTGLGLSISRELVGLLGGEIQLESEEGTGSVFTVYLPVSTVAAEARGASTIEQSAGPVPAKPVKKRQPKPRVAAIPDDREDLEDGETAILIIEDDENFAQVLMKECHGKGFKCLVSVTGEEGLELAEKYQPKAILLDIQLPGIDGWHVLSMLKEQTSTRHIPVHIISGADEAATDAVKKGAIGFLQKPVTRTELQQAFTRVEDIFNRKVKNLLVVEDDQVIRKSIVKLIGNGDVHTDETATGKETLEKLKSIKYDCMILDLGLSDMNGFELLGILKKTKGVTIPPVIIYTARELTRNEDMQLREFAESVIIKGVHSEDRLLDEASLFLHRVVRKLSSKKRKMIVDLHDVESMFKDKRVLIVDDDMRNVFALSKTLSDKGIVTLKAEDGQKALNLLEKTSDIDLVLMDIMMPVMDGYETMKRIRAQQKFEQLPIIALTAKAMKEDRSKCIAAGANDYLPKPVNLDRLFSTMRVWLYR